MKCSMCKMDFKLTENHHCPFCETYTENPLNGEDHYCTYCTEKVKRILAQPIAVTDKEIEEYFKDD